MPKITLKELETIPASDPKRYDENGVWHGGHTILDETLYDRVGDEIDAETSAKLKYVDTPVEETDRFSCISTMKTPGGREIMVLEESTGRKRLSWW